MPLEDVPAGILDHAVVLATVGSTAHGISVSQSGPTGDDLDLLGVWVPAPELVYGLQEAKPIAWRSKPEGVPSGAGDVDLVLHPMRKFVQLCYGGNPTVLGVLWSPEQHVRTEVGYALVQHRSYFSSKRAGRAFMGYAEQQYLRLRGERGQMSVNRADLVDAHGYDTKYAAHVLRLCAQGIALMRDGVMPMPLEQADRERILAVRAGALAFDDVIEAIAAARAQLEHEWRQSSLPDEPDRGRVNDLIVTLHGIGWGLA